MKFWETDLILRRLSNLSNLAQAKPYYWDYSQTVYDARRNLIKDEIQKPLEFICPLFYKLIDEIYSNQIRNAVAHSQYYFLYDSIHLTNKDGNNTTNSMELHMMIGKFYLQNSSCSIYL
jgi:hypothetical protein